MAPFQEPPPPPASRMKTVTISLFAISCVTLPGIVAQQAAPDQQLQPQVLLAHSSNEYGATQAREDLVEAEGRQFLASFDRQGAAIETMPMANGQSPRLELRYLGSRRGKLQDLAQPNRNPKLSDKVVRYHRDNVVETYTVSPNGFEQSFHIAQRPQGHGDLVLSIAVNGNVTAPAARSKHQALEFAIDGSRQIRYGEAIAFDRSGNRLDIATSFDGIGRIELTVPQSFLADATFPIVVDPAVGPVFIADSDFYNDTNPDVAYDLVNDRYLLVWQRQFTATTGIRAQLFNGNGVPLTSYIPLATAIGNGSPAVALCNRLTEDGFLVVWQQSDEIYGRMVSSTTGAPMAPAFGISSPAAGERDDRPTVSGPGNGAMMVGWQRTLAGDNEARGVRTREIYFPNAADPTAVNLSQVRDIQTLVSGFVRNVRLARSDVRTVVNGQTWWLNRIAWDRWWTSPAPGDFDVYTCSFRVRPITYEFAIVDPVGSVPGANSVGVNEFHCDIGSRADIHRSTDGLQYCIAWEDEGDIKAQMYDELAPVGAEIIVDDSPNFEGSPAVGAGYCEFTIGYLSITPPAEFDVDILAARVLLDGTVAINRRLIDDPGPQFQSGIAASSRPIHTVAEKQTNTSLLAWMGQTGPSGTGLNDVRARFFEPNAPSISPFGSGCSGPLGEMPFIQSGGGAPIAGNDSFELAVIGAPANSLAVLLIGDQLVTTPLPGAPGCNLYMGLPLLSALPIITDNAGNGSVPMPIPCSVPHGVILAFQWGIYTPGWNPFGWITTDNFDIRWSHL